MAKKARLIQYQCGREGSLFYYQTGVTGTGHIVTRCPVCGSRRLIETGRCFPALKNAGE